MAITAGAALLLVGWLSVVHHIVAPQAANAAMFDRLTRPQQATVAVIDETRPIADATIERRRSVVMMGRIPSSNLTRFSPDLRNCWMTTFAWTQPLMGQHVPVVPIRLNQHHLPRHHEPRRRTFPERIQYQHDFPQLSTLRLHSQSRTRFANSSGSNDAEVSQCTCTSLAGTAAKFMQFR